MGSRLLDRFIFILAILVLFCGVVGCFRTEEPEEKTDLLRDEQTTLRQEPTISLYIVETKETKNLPVEEYIQGVVAGEMNPNWPQEAYAAQAILARSFTMHWLDAGKKSRYGTDLSTDVEEAQAYDPSAISDVIRRAVEETRGKVMVYDGKYVKGWFHSYSGGQTATAEEGLGYEGENLPYVKSVELPDNKYVPDELKNWEAKIPQAQVQEALQKLGVSMGEIESVRISEKGPSGRAIRLAFRGTGGEREVSAAEFRIAVGSTKLRSTLIKDIRIDGGYLIAQGSGYGHGVGFSQWDAYMLAKEGVSAEDIVRRFFPGVEIRRVWR